jgi:tetratricopeptide (TPR) repeat protein
MAAERRLLVLLDNASNIEQVRPLLPASPTSAVLVTSRRVLGTLEGARTLHLDVLSEEEALELLCRIAGPERIAAETRAAAEVVRWCGRLPLAIRIAGARLVARPSWPIRELAEQLADTTRRLEALQAGELAVQASFDVSLQALRESPDAVDRTAAEAFGLLSLPDGPDIGVPAAARLIDRPQAIAEKVLERLADVQLIETPRPGRYQFHDLVRLYARQHVAQCRPEPERLAAFTRLIGFYTATAWRALGLLYPGLQRLTRADPRWISGGCEFADATAALDWLEAERSNLLAAITQSAHAAAGGASAVPAELPSQLTLALFGTIVPELNDRQAQAMSQRITGVLYGRLGRHEEAIVCLEQSITIFVELGDHRGRARCLNSLGEVYGNMGRHQEAISCLQECFTVFRELGDPRGEASSLHRLGVVYRQMGRYRKAIGCLQTALVKFREVDARREEAIALRELGDALHAVGRDRAAGVTWREGLTISEALRIPVADQIRARLASLASAR